jgi:hypothetical protein
MAAARNGKVFGMDSRYCIDNGAMIAQAGLQAFQHGVTTPMASTSVTQRFRTDEVEVVWREADMTGSGSGSGYGDEDGDGDGNRCGGGLSGGRTGTGGGAGAGAEVLK